MSKREIKLLLLPLLPLLPLLVALLISALSGPAFRKPGNEPCAQRIQPLALLMPCPQMVFSSSCTVYGLPEKVPITEDTPLAAISPYGRTKLFQVGAALGEGGSVHELPVPVVKGHQSGTLLCVCVSLVGS